MRVGCTGRPTRALSCPASMAAYSGHAAAAPPLLGVFGCQDSCALYFTLKTCAAGQLLHRERGSQGGGPPLASQAWARGAGGGLQNAKKGVERAGEGERRRQAQNIRVPCRVHARGDFLHMHRCTARNTCTRTSTQADDRCIGRVRGRQGCKGSFERARCVNPRRQPSLLRDLLVALLRALGGQLAQDVQHQRRGDDLRAAAGRCGQEKMAESRMF